MSDSLEKLSKYLSLKEEIDGTNLNNAFTSLMEANLNWKDFNSFASKIEIGQLMDMLINMIVFLDRMQNANKLKELIGDNSLMDESINRCQSALDAYKAKLKVN